VTGKTKHGHLGLQLCGKSARKPGIEPSEAWIAGQHYYCPLGCIVRWEAAQYLVHAANGTLDELNGLSHL
jgi:hypothetical protein